jgi:hypothetical protein
MLKKLINLYRKIFPKCVYSDGIKHKGFCKKVGLCGGQIMVPMCKAHRNNIAEINKNLLMPKNYGYDAKDIVGDRGMV